MADVHRARTANDTQNEAWAFGGWVGYKSGWLLDTFAMGATLYGSAPLLRPKEARIAKTEDDLASPEKVTAFEKYIIATCRDLEQHGGSATPPQLHGHDESAPKC